jgi:GMP synthase (glutamine-hydrolysing)
MIWRHPFPGPGLGVRLLCSNGIEDREGFGEIEPRVNELAGRYAIEALVLPIRSVGVKADLRAYEHPLMLGGRLEWDRMLEVVGTILKQVPGLNRCIWNLGPTMPAAARPVAAGMTRQRLDLLREADTIVMEGLRRHGLYDAIWQCPTVLVPLELDGAGLELVIVRPIHSERAMTATPASLPDALVAELRQAILALPGISGLALDVTSKPPGTIEWE